MITVNGNHLRNMPEQISKNTEDILDLQDATNALDGRVTDLENSVISDITLNDLHTTGETHLGDDSGDDTYISGDASIGGDAAVTGDISAANASFTGNETVGGTITATGDISAPNTDQVIDVVKGNQTPASYFKEGNIELNTNTQFALEGGSIPYGHWRISNGKLNIVLCLSVPDNTTITAKGTRTALTNGFYIPAEVAALLADVPSLTDYKALDMKQMIGTNAYGQTGGNVEVWLLVQSNGYCRFDYGNATLFNEYVSIYARFEFNFIL